MNKRDIIVNIEWAGAGCMRSEQGLDVRGVGGGGMYVKWEGVGLKRSV